ncbi:MAG TPA: hypothetical protein DCM45_01315 [Clostridiales bacterium]|nr:hypothetical protein [Clostridiales bacterium]
MQTLEYYLNDLQDRINPDNEETLEKAWLSFADLKCNDQFFAPFRQASSPRIEWPDVNINDAIQDNSLMIYSQLKMCSDMLLNGSGELMCVRMNYGTGIIPTMLGAEVFMMPYEHNTLPGARSLAHGIDDIRRIVSRGQWDYQIGLAGRVFSTFDKYASVVARYPKINRYIHVYNPDLQGPLALCELMWGSQFYLDLYDEPELVSDTLKFFTDIYIGFTEKWHQAALTFDAGHSVEWGMLHRGATIIRNDAAMNISGDMYQELIAPHDQRILNRFGGGVHFCGRGDHYIHVLATLNNLSVINLSQPEYNDMEKIYQNTVDKNIIIIGLRSDEVRRAAESGRNLRGMVHSGASMAAWLERDKR